MFVLLAAAIPPVSAQTKRKEPEPNPLAPILKPAVESSVAALLTDYRAKRRYRDDSFPMKPAAFDASRKDLTSSLTKTLGLNGWRVAESERKENSLAGKFQDRLAQAGFVTIVIEYFREMFNESKN
ncbi:MAG: hypothetical protein ACI9VS_000165 [Candidatus Binatia bacterium]|jgi:hypothetical protein